MPMKPSEIIEKLREAREQISYLLIYQSLGLVSVICFMDADNSSVMEFVTLVLSLVFVVLSVWTLGRVSSQIKAVRYEFEWGGHSFLLRREEQAEELE
jgi:hypothetical protein